MVKRKKKIRILLGCEENQDAVFVLMLQPETDLPRALEWRILEVFWLNHAGKCSAHALP